MSPNRVSVNSRWWYATVAIIVLLAVYVTQTPPDASLFSFSLSVIAFFGTLFCLVMDIRVVRRSGSSWIPSRVYVVGVLFTPVLVLYGYRRYRHIGLL